MELKLITCRDFKRTNLNKEALAPHQRELYELWLHRESLAISQKEAGEYLSRFWDVKNIYASQLISHELVCPRRWEIRTYSTGMGGKKDKSFTNGQISSQRMSDYLHFLGYYESDSKKLFDSLNTLSEHFKFYSPNKDIQIHPKAKEWQKSRTFTDSLDSMEGLGDFEW